MPARGQRPDSARARRGAAKERAAAAAALHSNEQAHSAFLEQNPSSLAGHEAWQRAEKPLHSFLSRHSKSRKAAAAAAPPPALALGDTVMLCPSADRSLGLRPALSSTQLGLPPIPRLRHCGLARQGAHSMGTVVGITPAVPASEGVAAQEARLAVVSPPGARAQQRPPRVLPARSASATDSPSLPQSSRRRRRWRCRRCRRLMS